MWDDLRDAWEWDSHFRRQIQLAVIVGLIGLTFAYLEMRVKVNGQPVP